MLDQKHALTLLTRLAARRPEEEQKLKAALKGRLDSLAPVAINVAVETGDPIGRVLADAFEDRAYDELSRSVESQVPFETTALRELGLVLIRQRYDKEIYQRPVQTDERALYIARNLILYGHRLQAVGKLSPALNSYLGAHQILNQLERNEATIPVMANVLNNIAVVQADLDPKKDTRELVLASIECHRWAVAHGHGSEFELADSLNTLATLHLERSAFAEAISPLQEALKIVESSRHQRDTDGWAKSARLKNNLGLALQELGDTAKAVSTLAESVALARKLSDGNPDVFQMFLGRYLANLAASRYQEGDIGGARDDVDESISIWKNLSKRRPDAFADDYLKALTVKALIERSEGAKPSAVGMSDKIIQDRLSAGTEPRRWKRWFRRVIQPKILAAVESDDWTDAANLSEQQLAASDTPDEGDEAAAIDLAETHMLRGIAKRRTGQLKDAIAAMDEALTVSSRATAPDTKMFRANVLRLRGSYLADDHRSDLAIASFQEAHRTYGASGAKAEQIDTATWVVDFLGSGGIRHEWVVRELEEAADALEAKQDDQSPPRLAAISARLALIAAQKRQPNNMRKTLKTCKECIAIVRSKDRSVEINAYLPLTKIAQLLAAEPKPAEALEVRKLAFDALGSEVHLDGKDAYAERVFDALTGVAEMHAVMGDSAAEILVLGKLVDLWQERISKLNKLPSSRFATTLDHIAVVLKRAGREDEALARAEEAAVAYETWYRQAPDQARIRYAGGLNNLSNRLWESGRRKQSLSVITKALDILEPALDGDDPALKLVLGPLIGAYIPRVTELGEPTSPVLDKFLKRLVSGAARP